MTQIWIAMIHYLLVAYIKFLNLIDLSLTEITDRIRDTLMQNMSLLEVLSWTRKNNSEITRLEFTRSARSFRRLFLLIFFTGQQ